MSLKNLSITFLVIIFLSACNSKSNNQFEVEGTITNNPNNKEKLYYLYKIGGNIHIDSVNITYNKFYIVDTLSHPAWIIISDEFNKLDYPPESLENVNTYCFIEPTKMKASIDLGNWENFQLTGSKSQDELIILNSEVVPIWKQKQEIYKSSIPYDRGIKIIDSLSKSEYLKIFEFINNYPQSYVSLYRMTYMYQDYAASEQATMDSIFMSMPIEMQNSDIGKQFQNYIGIHNFSIGDMAPDFTIKDINGNEVSLSALREENEYILLDFWASWCSPCRAKVPSLIKLYNQYHSKGLEIVGISVDTKDSDWKKAVEKDGSGLWINACEPANSKVGKESVANLYNVIALPSVILINKNGKVIAMWTSSTQSPESIEETLKKVIK